MILKNIDILNLSEAIMKLVNSDNELSIKTIYHLNKNYKKISDLKGVIEKQRTDIIIAARDQGIITINEDGTIKTSTDPDKEVGIKKFVNDLNELYMIDNELDLDLFDIEDLGDIKLSGTNKASILKIIKD